MIIEKAREAVSTYGSFADQAMIEVKELLAVIIGGRNADKAEEISNLRLDELLDMSAYQLESYGLSRNEALRVHASLLLAKKLQGYKKPERYVIRSPQDGRDYLMDEMRYLKQEHFVVLFLNTKNEVIKKKTVFVGSLNASVVHPREVFAEAVKHPCASIILAHNHPSGSPDPSQEDIHVTKRLVESGKLIGIEVIDHLIIGDQRFVSLKERGYM